MYNIKQRFEKIADKHPHYSSYTTFAETIRETGITEMTVRRWFSKLVDKDDYAPGERTAVLRHLVGLTEPRTEKHPSGTT